MDELIEGLDKIRLWHERHDLPVPHVLLSYEAEYGAWKSSVALKTTIRDLSYLAEEWPLDRISSVRVSLVAPDKSYTAVRTIYGKQP